MDEALCKTKIAYLVYESYNGFYKGYALIDGKGKVVEADGRELKEIKGFGYICDRARKLKREIGYEISLEIPDGLDKRFCRIEDKSYISYFNAILEERVE